MPKHSAQQIDIDAMLRDIALKDNAAVPFAQYRVHILEQTAHEANMDISADASDIKYDALSAARKKRLRVRATSGIVGAAAVLLIMLSVNFANENMPRTNQTQDMGGAKPETFMAAGGLETPSAESAMDDAAPAPAAAAPEAFPSQEEGNGTQEAAQDTSDTQVPPESDAAAPRAAIPEDPRAYEAIDAVILYLQSDPNNVDTISGAQNAASAVLEQNCVYQVKPLTGEDVFTMQLASAYIVSLGDAEATVRYIVEEQNMQVLGIIVE